MKLFRNFTIFIIFSLLFFSMAFAQEQLSCNSLFDRDLRVYVNSEKDRISYSQLAKSHCGSSASSNKKSWNAGLEATIKKIPISIFGGSSKESEQINNFCNTYNSKDFDRYQEANSYSEISPGAFSSYKACISALQNSNAKFELISPPNILSQATVKINKLAPAYDLKLNSVTVSVKEPGDENSLSCSMNVDGQSFTAKPNSPFLQNVKINETATINCRQTSIDIGLNTKAYTAGSVIVSTNAVSGGNMAIEFPADSIVAPVLASRIQEQMNERDNRMSEIEANFDRRLSGIKFKNICDGNGPHCDIVQPVCDTGWKPSGITHWDSYSGGKCGYGAKCTVCYKIPD